MEALPWMETTGQVCSEGGGKGEIYFPGGGGGRLWILSRGGVFVPCAAARTECETKEALEGHHIEEKKTGGNGEQTKAEGRKGETDGGQDIEKSLEDEEGAVEGKREEEGV
jgi:hypothetical protein